MKQISKPNLFIVGAAKAGTTAIWEYLNQHPEVYLSPVKEPHYFFQEKNIEGFRPEFKKRISASKASHQLFIQTEPEYLELFQKKDNQPIVGEASASYLYSEKAAELIHAFNPEAKILILLRDPIERAFSHYLMNRRMGFSNQPFYEDFMTDNNQKVKAWGISHLYLELGLYHRQVKRYFDHFPKDQIQIIFHEDLKANTAKELKKLCSFLKLSAFDFDLSIQPNKAMLPKSKTLVRLLKYSGLSRLFSKSFLNKSRALFFKTTGLPQLSREDRSKLLPFFEEDLAQLEKFLSKDLKHWRHE